MFNKTLLVALLLVATASGCRGQEPYPFIRYDANQDGKIDIADAQAIINLAMGLNADGTAKAAAPARHNTHAAETVTMSIKSEDMGGGIVRYALCIEGNVTFTGFQADVKTSGRIVTEGLGMSSMSMRSSNLTNGNHRILGLPGTAELQADGSTIAYVFVQGGTATFENVVLTTAAAKSIAVGGETTGVKEVREVKEVNGNSFFDLSGRKVNGTQKGIVIIGGKKVVVK